MKDIPFSTIRKMLERVSALESEGIDIARLDLGKADFDTPVHIKQAAMSAMECGSTGYTSNYGLSQLRQAIADKLKSDNNLDYAPDDEVLVTAGVSEAVGVAMLALLDCEDEVLVLEPVFPAYLTSVRLAGGVPVVVPTCEQKRHMPSLPALEANVSERTKMLVIATPNNPSGIVYDAQSLTLLADFAKAHDLIVVCDEIYEKIVYDGFDHISMASLPGMRERTITLNGFSKSYSMTGWRLGYAAACKPIIDAMVRVHQNIAVCANSMSQHAGIAALKGPQQPLIDMVDELACRRQLMLDKLAKIKPFSFVAPQAALYVYVKLSDNLDAYQLADDLLEKAGVAVVPWNHNHLRLSFGCRADLLELALNKLCDYMTQLDL